ncbi:MAG: hypothetical protein LBV51_00170 [Acholeplasmatales bacterium]|jgi:hypothetical protein|nr:hypothetical protein [Acholeplasmatales bacterium]
MNNNNLDPSEIEKEILQNKYKRLLYNPNIFIHILTSIITCLVSFVVVIGITNYIYPLLSFNFVELLLYVLLYSVSVQIIKILIIRFLLKYILTAYPFILLVVKILCLYLASMLFENIIYKTVSTFIVFLILLLFSNLLIDYIYNNIRHYFKKQ